MMFAYTIVHLLIHKKPNQSNRMFDDLLKKYDKFGLRLSEQFAEVRQVGGSKFLTKFTFLEVFQHCESHHVAHLEPQGQPLYK